MSTGNSSIPVFKNQLARETLWCPMTFRYELAIFGEVISGAPGGSILAVEQRWWSHRHHQPPKPVRFSFHAGPSFKSCIFSGPGHGSSRSRLPCHHGAVTKSRASAMHSNDLSATLEVPDFQMPLLFCLEASDPSKSQTSGPKCRFRSPFWGLPWVKFLDRIVTEARIEI